MTTITTFPVAILTTSSKAQFTTDRLVSLNWKEPSKSAKAATPNIKKLPSLCVSIPATKIEVKPEALATALQSAFDEMQDAAIRADIERQIGDYTGQPLPELSIDASIFSVETISANTASNRLSKDMLNSWFDTSLADNLMYALAAKAGYDIKNNPSLTVPTDLETKILKNIEVAKTLFAGLAAPKPSYASHILDQLSKAAALADENHLKTSITNKITNLLKPAAIELELSL